MPVTSKHISTWTRRDSILSQVLTFVNHGWPRRVADELKPFFNRHTELSTEMGCILWGPRVVVPTRGREQILQELHNSHPGMAKMKARARMFVWWPNIDKDIELTVKACNICQSHGPAQKHAPLHPWVWPDRPWSRLHVDFAGPYLGKMFLVTVDAHSKWLEVDIMTSATAQATIERLRRLFTVHGLPDTIVSDNGSAFTSQEFKEFVSSNGIKHVTTAPYHPASNGLAERAVQVLKAGLRRNTEGSLEFRLARTLFLYRTTPHSTTGVTPAHLLMGRELKTRLDLLRPHLRRHVEDQQERQSQTRNPTRLRCVEFRPGDQVFFHSFRYGTPWVPGKIVMVTGPVSVRIEGQDGRTERRHVDHVKHRITTGTSESRDLDTDCGRAFPEHPAPFRELTVDQHQPRDEPSQDPNRALPNQDPAPHHVDTSLATATGDEEVTPTAPEVRRSSRISRPPDRLDL